jgi:uroporphyrinogen-III synthase
MPCILLTQSEPAATRTAAGLIQQGYKVIANPLIVIKDRPLPCEGIKPDAWVVTSQHALSALTQMANAQDLVIAVGPHTCATAQSLGFSRCINAGGTVAHLQEWVQGHMQPSVGRLVYLSGEHIQEDLSVLLPAYRIERVVVYEAVLQPLQAPTLQALHNGQVDEVWLYSKRAAQHFVHMILQHDVKVTSLTIRCLHPAIQEISRQLPWTVSLLPAK